MNYLLFILLFLISSFVSPAIALFSGIVFALLYKSPYPLLGKKLSKYLLQIAIVGLGFGMNLHKSFEAGSTAMHFTIISVSGVIILGYFIGHWLKVPRKLSYLIAAGTAICGGSAIAAVSPIVDADQNETSMSLAVIFILNAIALFMFPPIGRFFNMSQHQFGEWTAIAIHDTSSVVGAASAYGSEALAVATTIKLTRALWIIPVSIASMLFFQKNGKRKISIPWFIFIFVLAMVTNTYFAIYQPFLLLISISSHKILSMSLFLIGSSLSINAIRTVGVRPVTLGIILWFVITVFAFIIII